MISNKKYYQTKYWIRFSREKENRTRATRVAR